MSEKIKGIVYIFRVVPNVHIGEKEEEHKRGESKPAVN
jgi:hypothetical protein